ncbi:outer membrane beta-barrel protein [Helicobacter brantae]|uniref:Outer membrane protein n=1 Tax=Helicobacter brantae TaxID=375927 RepID=A0A3D8J2P6_9HELI|nr:outer membrane beta-barrel protein [Helicobacter brantae]RDU71768.1 hypothetical protein CQA58_01635 [Helicobacter brantae]
MKKTLLSLAVASLVCASMAEARLFVGVEGGYTAQKSYDTGLNNRASTFLFSMPSTSVISDALDKGSKGYSLGVTLGTEDVGSIFGTRWYLGAGYTSVSKDFAGKSWSREYIDASVGFDLILNFFNNGSSSFGIFGGVSADYHYWLNSSDYKEEYFATFSKHIFDFSGKAGITTMLAKHNRLEVFAKLPIASMSITDSKEAILGGNHSPANVTFGASYKFIF